MVAGEPSGDLLGSILMRALKKVFPQARFEGVGGPLMCQEGLHPLFSMEELTVIGILEVLPKAFKVLKRVKEVAEYVVHTKPTALITIDAPAFSFRVGRTLRRLEKNRDSKVIHIHYGAPTVWAWRPKRAQKISKFLTHLLTLFSFEPPYFLKEGLSTSFVGHPILEGGYENRDTLEFRKHHHIPEDLPLICLLPGSRRGEVEKHLPIFLQTLRILSHGGKRFGVLLPTFAFLRPLIQSFLEKYPEKETFWVVEGEDFKKDAFASAQVALAASGTVALELAVAGTPMIITYKTSWLTAFIVRRMIQIPFVSMPNILLNKPVVPEFLQEACNPKILSKALKELLNNKALQEEQRRSFKKVRGLLSPHKTSSLVKPSEKAATVIQGILQREGLIKEFSRKKILETKEEKRKSKDLRLKE